MSGFESMNEVYVCYRKKLLELANQLRVIIKLMRHFQLWSRHLVN